MAGIFSFKCAGCGEIHEGSPSFGGVAPDPWRLQTDEVRETGEITDDICYYIDGEDGFCFIKTILEIPIHGVDEPFTWGIWVSISGTDFKHYIETWDEPDASKRYFGRICNGMPYYGDTYALTADVCPQSDDQRPLVKLHQADHELFHDYANGISIQKAQEIAERVMHEKEGC